MPKIPKPPLTKKDPTLNPDLQEKIEIHLNQLAQGDEAEAFEPIAMTNLAGELNSNPSLANFFFERILSQPSPRLSRLLLDLIEQVNSKPVQKGIKRTLYLLKQKGMDLPNPMEKKGEGAGGGILKAMDSVQVTGYLSEFDPARNRMLALLIPRVPKGKVFGFALIDPEGSLASLTALEVNKKGAIEILGELEEHSGHSFLQADPGQVAFVLKEAHDRKSLLSQEDEGIYTAIINLLSGLKVINPLPIIRTIFPPDTAILEVPLDLSRIISIPEVSNYQPAEEVIEPYRRAIQEVQEGILILSQVQKREQVHEIVLRASREIFQGQGRTDLVRYLEEAAYLYFLKGQLEEAKALCSAAQFLNNQRESEKAEGNPLLIWLLENALLGESPLEDEGAPNQTYEQTQGGIIIPPWVAR
jgi:hypothetical protein